MSVSAALQRHNALRLLLERLLDILSSLQFTIIQIVDLLYNSYGSVRQNVPDFEESSSALLGSEFVLSRVPGSIFRALPHHVLAHLQALNSLSGLTDGSDSGRVAHSHL